MKADPEIMESPLREEVLKMGASATNVGKLLIVYSRWAHQLQLFYQQLLAEEESKKPKSKKARHAPRFELN